MGNRYRVLIFHVLIVIYTQGLVVTAMMLMKHGSSPKLSHVERENDDKQRGKREKV